MAERGSSHVLQSLSYVNRRERRNILRVAKNPIKRKRLRKKVARRGRKKKNWGKLKKKENRKREGGESTKFKDNLQGLKENNHF